VLVFFWFSFGSLLVLFWFSVDPLCKNSHGELFTNFSFFVADQTSGIFSVVPVATQHEHQQNPGARSAGVEGDLAQMQSPAVRNAPCHHDLVELHDVRSVGNGLVEFARKFEKSHEFGRFDRSP
jgi:hypothetical protein